MDFTTYILLLSNFAALMLASGFWLAYINAKRDRAKLADQVKMLWAVGSRLDRELKKAKLVENQICAMLRHPTSGDLGRNILAAAKAVGKQNN